ncbi:carboxypeptidase-like regulatory domain-containing protein [Dyella acidiphila]|uniref:Carboxypeptidase regulatory-like domain-containing protein n=1 Tax=Dyella acidiphila TaxID=2775866 RepID=A0ABR9GCD0_9GAMM|nr:carboxypeptidase-like regulatory domain-containing protein [Dyella acidiphila]MBE1161712.1 carboxypeptidase regulatory-like domain-containing protein [Dyella acidiphila]
MNNLEYLQSGAARRHLRGALVVAAIVSAVCVTPARAQSTTATMFGQAPAGEVVTAISSTGLHRHETVNAKGRYKIGSLPAGDYTVTLEKSGQTTDTRSNINLMAARGTEVDFACPNDQCAESK